MHSGESSLSIKSSTKSKKKEILYDQATYSRFCIPINKIIFHFDAESTNFVLPNKSLDSSKNILNPTSVRAIKLVWNVALNEKASLSRRLSNVAKQISHSQSSTDKKTPFFPSQFVNNDKFKFRSGEQSLEYLPLTFQKNSYCLFKFCRLYNESQCLIGKEYNELACVCCEYLHSPVFEILDQNSKIFLSESKDSKNIPYADKRDTLFPGPMLTYEQQSVGFFQEFFHMKDSAYYITMSPAHGPILICLSLSNTSNQERTNSPTTSKRETIFLRVIITSNSIVTLRCSIPIQILTRENNTSFESFLICLTKKVFPSLDGCQFKQIPDSLKPYLLKFNELNVAYSHKIGVILCLPGQTTEQQMYNNETSTPSFSRFLDCIATKIKLKNFSYYLGGLDNVDDESGEESYFTVFYGHEIMFHVSTLFPYHKELESQLIRKKYIGNDSVTIIFQECGSLPINPDIFVSQFQKIFIVVKEETNSEENRTYSVAYAASKEIPIFGPRLPSKPVKINHEFRKFFLSLVLNSDLASKKCTKLSTMLQKAQENKLTSLIEHNDLKNEKIINMKQKKSKIKKVNSSKNFESIQSYFPGALVWDVILKSYKISKNDRKYKISSICTMTISNRYISFIQKDISTTIMLIPTCKVIGWYRIDMATFSLYLTGGYRVNIIMSNFDLGETMLIFKILNELTIGNYVISIRFTKEKFRSLNIETNSLGTIVSLKEEAASEYPLKAGYSILEVNKFLMSKYKTNINKKICTMQEPYDILFALPFKRLNDGEELPQPPLFSYSSL